MNPVKRLLTYRYSEIIFDLLDKQINAAIAQFEKEGGISEKLHKARIDYLKKKKN